MHHLQTDRSVWVGVFSQGTQRATFLLFECVFFFNHQTCACFCVQLQMMFDVSFFFFSCNEIKHVKDLGSVFMYSYGHT